MALVLFHRKLTKTLTTGKVIVVRGFVPGSPPRPPTPPHNEIVRGQAKNSMGAMKATLDPRKGQVALERRSPKALRVGAGDTNLKGNQLFGQHKQYHIIVIVQENHHKVQRAAKHSIIRRINTVRHHLSTLPRLGLGWCRPWRESKKSQRRSLAQLAAQVWQELCSKQAISSLPPLHWRLRRVRRHRRTRDEFKTFGFSTGLLQSIYQTRWRRLQFSSLK